MKKKILKIVFLVITLMVVAFTIWYFAASRFMKNVEANEILYIDIFNGNSGDTYKINNSEDISYIVENIQNIKLNKSGISVGKKGYLYKMTFFDMKGNIVDSFIINSHDTIRKGPFFYCDKTGSICVDYIKEKMIKDVVKYD